MTKLVLKDNFYYILAKLFFEIFVGYKSGGHKKTTLHFLRDYFLIFLFSYFTCPALREGRDYLITFAKY